MKAKFYTIDLTRIAGNGEFQCPRCGIEISPDDETEGVYSILETIAVKDRLEKMILRCNGCGSYIHLVGFQILNNLRKIKAILH